MSGPLRNPPVIVALAGLTVLCGVVATIAPLALIPILVLGGGFLLARRGTATRAAVSPMYLFLPVFLLYNGVGIALAQTASTGYQVLMFALATIAFALGYTITMRAPTSMQRRADRLALNAPLVPLLLVLAVGAVVTLALIAKSGIPILAHDQNIARTTFFPNGYASEAVVVPCHAALIAALVSLRWARPGGRRIALITIAVVASGLMLITANRGLLIAPLLTWGLFFLWHRPIRVITLLTGGVVIFLGFSYTGYQREYNSYGPTYDRDLAFEGYSGQLKYLGPGMRYVVGTSQVLDKTIAVFPRVVQHPYGAEFFAPLLHRPNPGQYLKETFGLSFLGFGVALGSINAFFLDFGLPGVVIGFLLFGSISAALYRRARTLEGKWIIGYALWMSNLLLSNYGHPFAFLSTALVPALVLILIRSAPVIKRDAAVAERARVEPAPSLYTRALAG